MMRVIALVALVSATALKVASTNTRSKWLTLPTRSNLAGLMVALMPWCPPNVIADARLNAATAAGTRVNSDAESLLRFGLPIDNKEARDIQLAVENVKNNIKARRIGFAKGDVGNAKKILNSNKAKLIAAAASAGHEAAGKAALEKFAADIEPLAIVLSSEGSFGTGSVQQRTAYDDAFSAQDTLAKDVSAFEQLLVPDNFKRSIPSDYAGLPALQGRAVVDFVIKKPDGSQYDVDGKLYDQVELRMVIDGYNAPLTGGNFVDLVNRGFYNKKVITRADGFVVQTGDADPAGSVHGFVPPGATDERKVPLEIALKGDKELLFGTTSEDDSRGSEATVLPFQSYGALGMARSEFEADSASSQFFWLLFESDLTPAGKNMLDGRYSCFGYTVGNADLLKDVKEGDVVQSAKVVSGLDKLEIVK